MTDQDTPLFEDAEPPEWTDEDFPWDDLDVELPEVRAAALDDVNQMLRGMSNLARRMAEYKRLEQQDLDRIKRRRELTVDKWAKRFKDLEAGIKLFAIAVYRRDKTFSHVLPNGSIKSNPVKDEIVVDDLVLVDWVCTLSSKEPLYEYRPKVFVGPLRARLAELEAEGVVRRFIAGPGEDQVTMIEPGARVTVQLMQGQVGRWMIVDGGETIDGLVWVPNGDDGVGRNFRIEL